MAEDVNFRVEKFNGQKLLVMEDEHGRFFISEGSIPTIGQNRK
jgi:hypothetical protein